MSIKMMCSNCGNESFDIYNTEEKGGHEALILRCRSEDCRAGTLIRGYVDTDTMGNRLAYFPAKKVGLGEGIISARWVSR